MAENTLYYGDNFPALQEHIKDESVDLIYLDPPFNSKATYNVLFRAPSGVPSEAQAEAFEDTWHWGLQAEEAFDYVIGSGHTDAADMLRAMRSFLGENDMMAYLSIMAARMLELHRVLKQTGSLYLHCDPTASHYLKLLLDAIFSPMNFRSEVIWRRSNAHNKISKQYGPIHDTLLFYSKGNSFFFQPGVRPVMSGYIKAWFTKSDSGGPYRTNMLTGSGVRTGSSGKPWKHFDPTTIGRHWAIPASLRKLLPPESRNWFTQRMLDKLYEMGWIYIPKEGKGQPKYKQYVGAGVPYQDIWAYQPYTEGCLHGTTDGIDADVRWLEHDRERLGYPTQKPEGLLERIIQSSCPRGGLVLDPFCGCGTTVHAAQKLARKWIGIDVTHLAIGLIEQRLKEAFPGIAFAVHGTPKDLDGARDLARRDKYEFQWWAVSLVNAYPVGGKKKGADRGIDGVIYFKRERRKTERSMKTERAIVSVKGGERVGVGMIKDLRATIERENSPIGIFITLATPTRPMKTEAAAAGFYSTPDGKKYPRIQIFTIEKLLGGQRPRIPLVDMSTSRKAQRENDEEAQAHLPYADKPRIDHPEESDS